MTVYHYADVIGEYLRDRIRANAQVQSVISADPPICMFGDLEQFPADEDLSASVPAIFVQPDVIENNFQAVTGNRYEAYYHYRIVYVDRIPEGVTHVTNRIKAQVIAAAITENVRADSSTPSTPNAQIVWIKADRVEFRPPEDVFVAGPQARLSASVVVCRVRLLISNQ